MKNIQLFVKNKALRHRIKIFYCYIIIIAKKKLTLNLRNCEDVKMSLKLLSKRENITKTFVKT